MAKYVMLKRGKVMKYPRKIKMTGFINIFSRGITRSKTPCSFPITPFKMFELLKKPVLGDYCRIFIKLHMACQPYSSCRIQFLSIVKKPLFLQSMLSTRINIIEAFNPVKRRKPMGDFATVLLWVYAKITLYFRIPSSGHLRPR